MAQERYINPYTDFSQAEISKYSVEERRQYEESRKDMWDYFSTMKTAIDKGRADRNI